MIIYRLHNLIIIFSLIVTPRPFYILVRVTGVIDCYTSYTPTQSIPGYTSRVTLACLGEWTPILTIGNGNTHFDRGWYEYRRGFGNVEEGYWVGNQALFYLTSRQLYVLRIDMWDQSGEYRYSEFDSITVEDESSGYQLQLQGDRYSTVGLGDMAGARSFYTNDVGNLSQCAASYGGGWWFQNLESCLESKLTGNPTNPERGQGAYWATDDDWSENATRSLARAVMRIIPNLKQTKGIVYI